MKLARWDHRSGKEKKGESRANALLRRLRRTEEGESHHRQQGTGNDPSVRGEDVDCLYIRLIPGDGRTGG